MRPHFLPPPSLLATIPKLYATEPIPCAEKVIHVHYFIGSCDWWIAELDPESLLAFGFANLGDPQCAEWGYVDLNELAEVQVRHDNGVVFTVLRDIFFEPVRFGDFWPGEEER